MNVTANDLSKLELDGGNYLRILREAVDLNQRELAEKLGYRRGNIISMIETGRCKFPQESWPKAAEIFGVDRKVFVTRMLKAYAPEIYTLLH